MVSFDNSFTIQPAAIDPDVFFDRIDIIKFIYNEIVAHACTSLVSTPLLGKSSILRFLGSDRSKSYTQHDISRYIFVYLDFRRYTELDLNAFFTLMFEQVRQQCTDRIQFQPLTSFRPEDNFIQMVTQIKEQHHSLVLLFDSLDAASLNPYFDHALFQFLRSQAQAMTHNLIYITASLVPLFELAHPGILSSQFFNIFGTTLIKPFTPSESESFLTKGTAGMPNPFTPVEVQQLLPLLGGHPFFLETASFLRERAYSDVTKPLDRNHFEQALYLLLLPHFKSIWAQLETEQQNVLKRALQAPHTYKGQQRMHELTESQLFLRFIRLELH